MSNGLTFEILNGISRNFKVGAKLPDNNGSKICWQSLENWGTGYQKANIHFGPSFTVGQTIDCLLFQYMLTHGTKRAEIDFMVLLTIFEYAESNAEWCQAQLFMQRLEFYDLKSASKIARKSLRNKDFSQYKAYVCLLYMWPTVWLILQCF